MKFKYNHKIGVDPKLIYFLSTDKVITFAGWKKSFSNYDNSILIVTHQVLNPLIRIWPKEKQYEIFSNTQRTRQSIENFENLLRYNKYRKR